MQLPYYQYLQTTFSSSFQQSPPTVPTLSLNESQCEAEVWSFLNYECYNQQVST